MTVRGPSRRAFLRSALGLPLGLGALRREAPLPGSTSPPTGSRPSLQEAAMRVRPIPSSGETIPVIGLGTWQTFDVPASDTDERRALAEVLRRFVSAGGRVVDSSPMYGRSEEALGELAEATGVADRLFWATKVWTEGRAEGVEQMERSMELLGVPRLDLMQVHNLVDADTHLATLSRWKADGRVRYVGVTHYRTRAYDELERVMEGHDLDFVQLNYNLEVREAERRILDVAADRGVAVLVNRPFQQGAMFRKVRGRALPGWAAEIGADSWARIFLKYVVSHPHVTCAIPATSDPGHLDDNVGAGRGELPDEATRQRIAAWWDGL